MTTPRKYHGDELPDGWRMVRLGDVAEVNREHWGPTSVLMKISRLTRK